VAENNLPGMLSAKRASEQRAKWAGREAMQKQANAFFDAIPFEPDLTPAECWQDQWDWDFKKKAAVEALPTLLKAKEHSDKKQYNRKTALMILLLQSKPDEFVVDQEDPHFPGVTHVPTGFRIHVPKDIIPGNIGVIERASKEASTFEPDLDPDALRGEYNALYGKAGPRLASMQQWPDDWIPDSSNLGWLDWYFNYTNGERNDDDEKQIKRWKAFKARQGAQFVENPTPRRAFALRNWAIDPLKLLPNAKIRKQVEAQMAEYKNQAEEEWREKHAWFDRRELEAIADFLNKEHQANIPLATESSELLEQRILDHVTSEDSDTNAMLMDMGEDGLKKVQEEQSKMKPLKDPLTPSSLKSVFDSGNI
jgi:hypothetical protein